MFEDGILMDKLLFAELEKYAANYYNHSSVEAVDTGAIRIFVPEADQTFLLGLSKFNVRITKIVPAEQSHRIRISVMEMKD